MAVTSTSALDVFAVCLRLVTLWWLDAGYEHLGLYVNQLGYIIYTFENRQTDPKPAQILPTRLSQYLPSQSN